MNGHDKNAIVTRAYEAWNAKDYKRLLDSFEGGLSWIVPGDNRHTGKLETRDRVTPVLDALGRSDYAVSPRHFIEDAERVVVLAQVTLDGVQHGAIDVWTFEAGGLVKYQHASTNTMILDRVLDRE